MSSQIQHSSSASYAKSGFGNRMGWGSRPALLLIDVCKAYWSADSPLSLLEHEEATNAPGSMRRLLAAARKSNVPVVWTKVEYSKSDMADAGLFWLKSKTLDVWKKGDTRGFDGWVEGLEPADDDVVVSKKYASGFFGTTLATELRVETQATGANGTSTLGTHDNDIHQILRAFGGRKGLDLQYFYKFTSRSTDSSLATSTSAQEVFITILFDFPGEMTLEENTPYALITELSRVPETSSGTWRFERPAELGATEEVRLWRYHLVSYGHGNLPYDEGMSRFVLDAELYEPGWNPGRCDSSKVRGFVEGKRDRRFPEDYSAVSAPGNYYYGP
ncbi:Isochorismatase-like protein [Aspergillus venezuelensis]